MLYVLVIHPEVIKDLGKIPPPDRARISKRIDDLARDPRPPGMKRLRGPSEYYRLRVGDYRVLYHVHDNVLEVVVVRVGHRKDVYRKIH